MKKRKLALLIIGVFILVFVIVTGFNMLTVTSKQPAPNPTKVVINEEEAIAHLSKAITYKTVSYQDRSKFDFKEFDKFIAFLQESFAAGAIHRSKELLTISFANVFFWYK